MNERADRLILRALGVTLIFTLLASGLLAVLTSRFLVLSGEVAFDGSEALSLSLLAGGSLAACWAYVRLRRHRFTLRALSLGSQAIEAEQLSTLSDEPARIALIWLFCSLASLALTFTVLRPAIVDLSTGANLTLLGGVIVAAASLPLFVLVRSVFLRTFELAPVEIMRSVVEDADLQGIIQKRVPRRLIAAVTTPVVVLVLGSSLIVSAHLRRADQKAREETARVLARAALELRPGAGPGAGLEAAIAQAETLGFYASVSQEAEVYRLDRLADGEVRMVTPLDDGSAQVHFQGSLVGVLAGTFVLVSLFAIGIAGGAGTALGHALGQDLRMAIRDVRDLGTAPLTSGGAEIVNTARFAVVARLGSAIERLAERFHVFANAQERAISARKAAARMRGLFFASVSHDLKSPLNAILGFTELVRANEPLSDGQRESLELIGRRGRELLALIETILDAARVDAGQLSLVLDRSDVRSLVNEAVLKGKDLGGDRDVSVVIEISEELAPMRVDRVRMPRAMATFIGHALRVAESPLVHVRALPAPNKRWLFEVEVTSAHVDKQRLRAMMDLSPAAGPSEHRGLALGLRLARSIVELHGGKVDVKDRGEMTSFALLLPAG
ncbi:MAG TPA: HAMP domain-containing sensor histidine kinase [Polyangiaceae bacterium]